MGILVSCQSIAKSFSSRSLFSGISFGVEDDEKLGLIGPNGSGKSTLLKILAGMVTPDQGNVVSRKKLRVSYVPQDESFPADQSINTIVERSAAQVEFLEHERAASIDSTLTNVGFPDKHMLAGALSGGWRKRLALACALAQQPELLLIDEPTNHLDLEGVLWLEDFLKSCRFSYIVVSHDRAFLEGVSNRVIELNAAYPQGFLSVKGNYSQFLISREEQLNAQVTLQQSLASQVRREIAWLQRGARARQTKSRGRIEEAGKLMAEFTEVKQRNAASNSAMQLDFDASNRKTKELISVKGVKKSFGSRCLLSDLNLVLSPGVKLGLVGRNGSGKTTLLRLIIGEVEPDGGVIKRAPDLKILWFDQNRQQLDQSKTLRQSLAAESDSVEFRGRKMHITAWARRFLFKPEQLDMTVDRLSGGEQARILIANLMLKTADILILDEPTNDLDIPSLEVLEESLEEFPGAIILVSHDRMMLDSVSTQILALNGNGGAEFFADYEQCEQLLQRFSPKEEVAAPPTAKKQGIVKNRTQLSTAEKRELSNLPEKIEQKEADIATLEKEMEKPDIASDYVKLNEFTTRKETLQHELERLFTRWESLEGKANN
jgi:ABC transport system ATP-binding/permease protein